MKIFVIQLKGGDNVIKELSVKYSSGKSYKFAFSSSKLVMFSGKDFTVNSILDTIESAVTQDISDFAKSKVKSLGSPINFNVEGDSGKVYFDKTTLSGDLYPKECITLVRYESGENIRVVQEQDFSNESAIVIGRPFVANKRYSLLSSRGYSKLPVIMGDITSNQFTVNEVNGTLNVVPLNGVDDVPSWVNIVFLLLQEAYVMEYNFVLVLSCLDKVVPFDCLQKLVKFLLKCQSVSQLFIHTNKDLIIRDNFTFSKFLVV